MITNAQDDSLTIDTAKLEEVMAIIENQPENHYQNRFICGDFAEELAKGIDKMEPFEFHIDRGAMVTECGSAACLAGWAANLYAKEFGYKPVYGGRHFIPIGATDPKLWVACANAPDTASLAMTILGLNEEQATTLFAGGNTRVMLRMMVKDLCNTGDVRPLEEYRQEDWDNYCAHMADNVDDTLAGLR